MGFLNNLINGISLGSIYAVIALGYTLVYGIAKMLNFAHGDVIMVGGYVIFYSTTSFDNCNRCQLFPAKFGAFAVRRETR